MLPDCGDFALIRRNPHKKTQVFNAYFGSCKIEKLPGNASPTSRLPRQTVRQRSGSEADDPLRASRLSFPGSGSEKLPGWFPGRRPVRRRSVLVTHAPPEQFKARSAEWRFTNGKDRKDSR